MRIGLLGDTHGIYDAWEFAIEKAEEFSWEHIVQLGDFGLFRLHGAYLDFLQTEAEDLGINFLWLDGNHDDHTLLQEWGIFDSVYPEPLPNHPNVIYLPRGSRFELDGVSFGVMGGAGSIDKDWRVKKMLDGYDPIWWETELITDEQRDRAIENLGWVDVLLVHDCLSLDIPGLRVMGEVKDLADSRNRLLEVVMASHPRLVVHGHMHHHYRRQYEIGRYRFDTVGLGCDGTKGSLIELTLEGGRAEVSQAW